MIAANASFVEKTGNLGNQNCCAKSWIEVLSWKIEFLEASLKNSVVTQDIPIIPTPSALQLTMCMQRAHSPLPFPPLGYTLCILYLGRLCFQMAPRWGILTHIVADGPLKIIGVKQIFWETTSTSDQAYVPPFHLLCWDSGFWESLSVFPRLPQAPSYLLHSIQFSSVSQSCLTLCDPMNCSTPDLPVHHQLPELTQIHVHQVGDAIQPSHPLSSPSPLALNPSQHQSLFQWVNSSYEVAKVLEFQL